MGISTVRLNSRVSLLSIDSIAEGHTDDSTCTAPNSAGSVNHTATLLVLGERLEQLCLPKLPEMTSLTQISGRSVALFFQNYNFPAESGRDCLHLDEDRVNLIEFKFNLGSQ